MSLLRSPLNPRRLRVALALPLLGLALAVAPASAADKPEATELEKVRAYVQPSIVYLGLEYSAYVYDTFNQQYVSQEPVSVGYQCTGYVVNPDGYIATAGHCVTSDKSTEYDIASTAAQMAIQNGYYNEGVTVDDAVSDYILTDEDGEEADPELSVYAAWGVAAGEVKAGKPYTARVLESQEAEKGDAALLKTETKNLQAIKLSDVEPEVGKDIVSIGYPGSVDQVTDLDFAPSYKDGTVSSKKTTAGGLFKTYEISAAMSGGMSGGPTVDLGRRVIGFNSFGIAGEEQQFNFIRPSSLTMELMRDAGVKNTVGEISTNYNAGLDAYFDGDRSGAIESLQKVLDEQPTNEMAREYMKKAKLLEEGPGVGTLLLIPLGLAAAGGGAFVAVKRRKAKGATSRTAVEPMTPQPALLVQAPVTSAAAEPEAPTASAESATTATASTRPKFCRSCGDPVDEDEKFCDKCGTKLE